LWDRRAVLAGKTKLKTKSSTNFISGFAQFCYESKEQPFLHRNRFPSDIPETATFPHTSHLYEDKKLF